MDVRPVGLFCIGTYCGRLVCDAQQWGNQSEQKQGLRWNQTVRGKRQLKSSPGRQLMLGCSVWLFLLWGAEREREAKLSGVCGPCHWPLRPGTALGSFGGSSPAEGLLFHISTTQFTQIKDLCKQQSFGPLGRNFTIRVQWNCYICMNDYLFVDF